jgi:hypothetical protein
MEIDEPISTYDIMLALLATLIRPPTLTPDPVRANERIDTELPMLQYPNTLSELPKRPKPLKLIVEPRMT